MRLCALHYLPTVISEFKDAAIVCCQKNIFVYGVLSNHPLSTIVLHPLVQAYAPSLLNNSLWRGGAQVDWTAGLDLERA